MLYVALLVVHVAAGAAGMLLGPAAMHQDTRRFASGLRTTGKLSAWYAATVLLVCLSATGLVIVRRHDLWWLVLLSALTYGLVSLARVSARRRYRGWTHGYVHGQGGSYIALVTALVVVAFAVDGPIVGVAVLVPWLAPTAIGTVLIEVWRRRLAAPRVGADTAPVR